MRDLSEAFAARDENFPYRVAGLVEQVEGRWLRRHCQGSESSS